MTKPASDSSFTSDVARFYESILVPLIFEPYADDLAARAEALGPNSVLEVACGTGVVTRALAAALPSTCAIFATDLNDVMSLPYPDESVDLVICQFGVMFFPDRVAAYREIRRVLRPAGTFLFNVWNDIESNEFADVVTEAVSALYPADPPVFLTRTPHGHGSPTEIENDLRAAGFEECRFSQRNDISAAASPDLPAIAYCQGTPLRNEIEAREPGGLERVTAAATGALRSRYGDGPIEGRISAVVVAAS